MTRPTDEEFAELARKRDAGFQAMVAKIYAEQGWNPPETVVHASHAGKCYCACPDGPCQHIWDGPTYESDDGCMMSGTCSRCGEICAYHDMRCGS